MQRAQRKALDVLNTLGLSNSLLRLIERRNRVDKWIKYAGMLLTVFILIMFWRWTRWSMHHLLPEFVSRHIYNRFDLQVHYGLVKEWPRVDCQFSKHIRSSAIIKTLLAFREISKRMKRRKRRNWKLKEFITTMLQIASDLEL